MKLTGAFRHVLTYSFVLLAGCSTMPTGTKSSLFGMSATTADQRNTSSETPGTEERVYKRRTRASVDESLSRLRVVEGARSLIGADVLTVKGKTFPYDCTGLVRAAYWYAGIDLTKDFSKYTGNGVTRIYRTLESDGLLYTPEVPAPGDIIFWDNTYDRNEDGMWNDPLTHVGIVVDVSYQGQIKYVHANYRKGIVPEYMNLRNPDTNTKTVFGKTVTVNSAMRMKGQVVNAKWLSSHLLREFGRGYLLG